MDIIKKGTYILPQAKGYGTLKHSNTTIKFTNHITLWGKFQMANAIFYWCFGGTVPNGANGIPKFSGLSILCRRVRDTATATNAQLYKSFFEINAVKTGAEASHTFALDDSHLVMPKGTTASPEGHDISGNTAWFEIGTQEDAVNKLTAEARGGIWGDSGTASGTMLSSIWNTTNSPHSNNDGLKNGVDNMKKARIAGISMIMGGLYGDMDNDGVPSGSLKVWRDPSALQALHIQEASRTDYGDTFISGTNLAVAPVGSAKDDDDTSADVRRHGHYYPSVADHNSADQTNLGTTPTRAEAKDEVYSDLWRWEDTAHDTFAHSSLLTHYYTGQTANGNPYAHTSLDGATEVKSITDNFWDQGATNYLTTPAVAIPFARWGEAGNTGVNYAGDQTLDNTVSVYEVNYNTGGLLSGVDHLIDENDQISAKYTVDFAQTTIATNDLNSMGALSNTTPNLASGLAKTFGQEGGEFNTWTIDPDCAFNYVKILDRAGNLMATGTTSLYEQPITAVLVDTLSPATTGVNTAGNSSVYGVGSMQVVDSDSKRPRVLKVLFDLKFTLVKYSAEYEAEKSAHESSGNDDWNEYGVGANETVINKNPDKIEFCNGTSTGQVSLFTIQIASGTAEEEYLVESPYYDSSNDSEYLKFSDGAEMSDNALTWQLQNNLIVKLAFYLA